MVAGALAAGLVPARPYAAAILLLATLSLGLVDDPVARAGGEEARPARVDIRFRAGVPLDSPVRLLPVSLHAGIERWAPLVNPEAANRLHAERMARWVRFDLVPGTSVDDFIASVVALDVVEVAEQAAESAPDPDPGGVP